MGDGSKSDQIHAGSSEETQGTSTEAETIVTLRLDPEIHRLADFKCARSERVQGFFGKEFTQFVSRNYCRVFVLPNPDDRNQIWGFYTLSPGLVHPEEVSKTQQRRLMPHLPIPMARVGFLGRDDRAPKELGLGSVMIHDAALRIQRCEDLTAWGLYLDAENEGVAAWYENKCGFKRTNSKPLVMYASLRALLPQSK